MCLCIIYTVFTEMFLNRHYNSHVLAEPKHPVCRKQDEIDANKQQRGTPEAPRENS